jgi:CBS domain-containing protein
MQAKDVMTTPVISVSEQTRVHDVVRLLLEHRISAVPVVDADQRVLGMVSEGDLLRAPGQARGRQVWWLTVLMLGGTLDYERIHGSTAGDVMNHPIVAVAEDTPLNEIARLLERRQIKRVPVLRDGRLVGIVSRANLLHGLAGDIIEQHEPGAAANRSVRDLVVDALRHEPLLASRLINVTVNDGTVALWGVVENGAQRDAAERAARGVTGVRSVENNLCHEAVSGLPV